MKANVNMASQPAADDGKLVDLRQLFAPLRKHWLPVVIVAIVTAALVFVVYATRERRFQAAGLVGLERTEAEITPTAGGAKEPTIDSAQVDTEVQVLQSPAVLKAAVEKAGFSRDPAFAEAFGTGDQPMTPERAASLIRGSMTVNRQGLSYALTVVVQSRSPEMSAKVANAVIDSYVNGQVSDKSAARTQSIALLGQRLDQLRGQVLAADTEVADYRQRSNLVAVSDDQERAQAQMAALNNMLAENRALDAAAQSRARLGSTDIVAAGVLNGLRSQAVNLAEQQAQIAKRYGPNHPDRIAIDGQLQLANRALAAEEARIRSAAAADARSSGARSASVQSSIAGTEQKLVAGNAASVRLAELIREAQSAQQIYEAFLERYRRELASQGTEQSRSYIISLAQPIFRPVSPDPLLFVIMAVFGGLLLGFVTALGLEAFERGLRSREEVEDELGLPVVAAIPDIATDADGSAATDAIDVSAYVLSRADTVTAEAFRAIRHALKIGQQGQTVRTVAISSSVAGEGKTTNAIALARSSAAAGYRVLLIDCDIRWRASSRTLAAADAPAGLIDVLSGTKTLDEAMIHEDESGVFILPQTQNVDAPYDLVSSRAMATLLEELGTHFDLIVLDTAPALIVAEARGVCALADVTLMTVRWRRTPLRTIRSAITQLERAGATTAGVLLSQVDLKAASKAGDNMAYYRTYPVSR